MKIVISSGHGKYIRGASGAPIPPQLDEVDEARKVVDAVAALWRDLGVDVVVYHDDVSTSQNENLNRIVDFHNSQGPHDLDVSVHFNAYDGSAHGCEVLYVTQAELAADVSDAISEAGGFTDRGAKYRSDLFFLGNTAEPAILIETCFCDSTSDSNLYREHFDAIVEAIAETISGQEITGRPPIERPEPEPPPLTEENRVEIIGTVRGDVTVIINGQPLVGDQRCANVVRLDITMTGDVVVSINGQDFHSAGSQPPAAEPLGTWRGKASWFGGPNDTGVDPDEGLAFLYEVSDAPELFLPVQPPGTSGLARRLDPDKHYVAVRWDYDVTPKEMLASGVPASVRSIATGRTFLARPADWGPHQDTGRVADVSPGLLAALGIETDDEVEVIYPAPGPGELTQH
jgi:N-acetylmuramoyl-L-alanine amidase